MVLKKIIFPVLLALFIANLHAAEKNLQQETIRLNNENSSISAIIKNEQPAELIIQNSKNKTFIFGENTTPNYPTSLHFKILHFNKVHFPVLVAIAAIPGGSNTLFITKIIRLDMSLSIINAPSWETMIGEGFHIFNLDKEQKISAIVWNIILGQSESHPDAHKYKITLYHWNGEVFEKFKEKETTEKYSSSQDALKELGFNSVHNDITTYFPQFYDYY